MGVVCRQCGHAHQHEMSGRGGWVWLVCRLNTCKSKASRTVNHNTTHNHLTLIEEDETTEIEKGACMNNYYYSL